MRAAGPQGVRTLPLLRAAADAMRLPSPPRRGTAAISPLWAPKPGVLGPTRLPTPPGMTSFWVLLPPGELRSAAMSTRWVTRLRPRGA